MSDPIKIQKHAIDYIRETAKTQEHRAFFMLQIAQTDNDQFAACERMELWQAVQILLDQRDKLQKYVRLLVISDGEETTATAAREYLEQIGIEI